MNISSEPSPLVERTAQRIVLSLRGRNHQIEAPLPTHRQWAEELTVSHFTVSKAMKLLKDQGLVESTEGSYTFLKSRDATEAGAEQSEITMWFNSNRNVRRMRQSIIRSRFQKGFTEDMPGLKFSERDFNLPMTEFFTQMLAAFVQGKDPVLAEFPQTYLEFLEAHGVLSSFPREEGADYLDEIDERFLEHSMKDGQCRFLPFACSYSYLVCNQTLMRKAGLEPEEEFSSWDDLAKKCERMKTALGGEPIHVSEDGLFWLLLHWIYQADEALPATGRLPLVDWQSTAARVAMDFFLEMVFDRQLIRVNYGGKFSLSSPFWAGKVPMTFGEIMLSTALELDHASDFTIKPVPPGPNGIALSLMNTVGWTGNAHADKVVQQRAWEYAFAWERWLHLDAGGEAMKRLGVAPSLFSLLKNPEKDQFSSCKIPSDWQAAFRQIRERGRWEAPDCGMMCAVQAPLLRAEVQKGHKPDPQTLLTHLLLAQHEAGIPSLCSGKISPT